MIPEGWGTRSCEEQNEAIFAIDKLRDALQAAENAMTVKIVLEFKRGVTTDDEFVRSIKENHAATAEFRAQLNRISSRINA